MKKRECPHCHQSVSPYKCSFYLWQSPEKVISCNHCGKQIHPFKEPVSRLVWFILTFLFATLPVSIMNYFRIALWKIVLIEVLFIVLAFLVAWIILLIKIKFIK